LALERQGQFKEALAAIQRSASLFPPASHNRQSVATFTQRVQFQIALDERLSAVVAGKLKPANDAERIALASLAQAPFRRLCVAATSLYTEAFQASPNLAVRHRNDAACAAALAGSGQGNDAGKLDATDRAQLRYAALGWLQDDLSPHARQLASPDAEAATNAREALLHWQKDPDLAAVRDREHLAKLPEAEQVAWGNLWVWVEDLLARHKPRK
jgi:hypothetical protein